MSGPEPAGATAPGRAANPRPWAASVAWVAALAAGVVLLAAVSFRTRDPDSVLHVRLATQGAGRPATAWIAPTWPPGWYMAGPYREHPAGILLVPALISRLGYPAAQAPYAANAIYQVLSLILIQRVAAAFATLREARTVAWCIQLLPIAFTYRIRANHEQAVLLFLLLALWATERSRSRPAWAGLAALAFAALALVKGLFAALAPPACALWLLARPPDRRRRASAWLGLVAASAAIPLTALAYEGAYRHVTGEPFLSVYLGRQIGVAAEAHSTGVLAQKAYNLAWYLGRLTWFAFPWSVAAAVAALRVARDRRRRVHPSVADGERQAGRGLAFALGLTALYLVLFSLSDRKADRYVFPAYYALGACGVVAAARGFAPFHRLAARVDALGPALPALVWMGTFAAHLGAGYLNLPRIKLWPSD